jgi:two-component system NtrC family sensor kinase
MSATPDSTLADPQQIIADLKRQLAESNAERDEALQRETATAEVLQVINSSPGDLAPVFDAMLERAMDLCEAALGILFLRDGERVRAAATCGLPSRMNEYVRAGIARNPNSRMSQGEAVEHIADLTQLPLASHPAMANAVELGGARTMLNVALTKDAASLGFFSDRPLTELRGAGRHSY